MKLREIKILNPLFIIRDHIMDKFGFFSLKRKIKRNIYFKRIKYEDEIKRRRVAEAIMSIPEDWLTMHGQVDVIISLTSHGKRVEYAAPYAIYSILQQKVLPKRIILNLNREKWSDDKLPNLLHHLLKVGVEVVYVEDIGPYTKFLPTLETYSDSIIVTIDDDIYYDSSMLGELLKAYERSDKRSIICRNGMRLQKNDGKFLTYSNQFHISQSDDLPGIPFGVSGVLYPPRIFDAEIFNRDVYDKLCPRTDDIWIGVMALRRQINVVYIHDNSWASAQVVDHNDEFNQNMSTAMHFTNDEKANEIFKNLIDYYHLED